MIATIKLNSAFPLSQVTYSDEDLLKFANHELFLQQVPSVLQYHEDYFSFRENVPLKPNKVRYDIPYRAIGNKIYDVYYTEPVQKILRKLNRIDAADKASLQYNNINSNVNNIPTQYYIESNQVVLASEIGSATRGALVFVYYLRPNNLVLDERAATCVGFAKEITISASISDGDRLTITTPAPFEDSFGDFNTSHTLNSVTYVAGEGYEDGEIGFVIGVYDGEGSFTLDPLVAAQNLNIAINTQGDIASTISAGVLTLRYTDIETKFTPSGPDGILPDSMQGIEFDNVPDNITNNSLVDFLKKKGGHRTYTFDIKLGKTAISGNVIKFRPNDIPTEFSIEDYVCSQFECIIPQIPSDLHSLLAERTVARILEAQGDLQGLQAAQAKISMLEAGQATMSQNRVDGSPRKVSNRNSFLRQR